MAEDDDGSSSPPLPRGTYNFNFDDLDDNIDPFKPGRGLLNSPDKEMNINPFESKSKLSSSPPIRNHMKEDVNPFQTKSKLGQSPPNSGGFHDNPMAGDNESLHDDNAESYKTTTDESPIKSNTFVKKKKKSPKTSTHKDSDLPDESQGDRAQDGGADADPKTPEKKPSPKKSSGIRKPKAKSKFKPPANFGVKDTEDVVIFAPPEKNTAENSSDMDNTTEVQEIEEFPPPPTESEIHPQSDNTNVTVSEIVEDSDKMNTQSNPDCVVGEDRTDLSDNISDIRDVGQGEQMIDSVHDFGANEMPMENNEEFVPASDAFNEDDEAWQMMEKMNNKENASDGNKSLTTFDRLAESEVPDKVTQRSSETSVCSNSVIEDDDLILMNTPPSNKTAGTTRAGSRHPAARALQEQVEGDGAPGEATVVDKMLFSAGKGGGGKLTAEEQEKYFDALEYPYGSRKSLQHELTIYHTVTTVDTLEEKAFLKTLWEKKKMLGDNEASRMNAANKKHGDGSQEAVVQLVQVLKYSQSDWNKMKQELELDYNARILNKEREWSKKLADREKKIAYLEDQSLQLRSANEDMKHVVAEFDKTITQLQVDKEKASSESRTSFDDVVKERDQALEDLQSVETAFSDLHQRYERTKGVVEGLKKNEEILKKCVQDYQQKLKAAEDKAVSIRQQAEEKLDLASMEMDKLRKSTTAEVARLEAALKKSDLKIHGLERNLEQKVKENEELTSICDELIAKVGGD